MQNVGWLYRRAVLMLVSAACSLLLALETMAVAQDKPATFTPSEEIPGDYPEGAGREETFYACTACHGFKIIAQQGMVRRQWDETLDTMFEKHNMPELDGKAREIILDYLESTFPPRATGKPGWQNPFLK
jgi:hypothetical protein